MNALWDDGMSRPHFWLRCIGSGVFTLVSVMIVAVLWRDMGALQDPGLILLLTVAVSTYLAGGMAGMLSAAIVLFCSFILFSHPLYPFRYSDLDWRQMMVIVVACPIIALMVGSLKEQVDQLRSASQEAQELKEEIRRTESVKEAQFVGEQCLNALVDCMPDYAVCTLDANGAVRSWNASAERLLGYNDPEIVGQSYSRFFTREDLLAKHPERLLEQASFSGRVEQEGWRVRKGGGRLHTRTSLFALTSSQGAASGYLLVIRDFTSLEEANLAALRVQAELDALKAGSSPA